MATGDRSLSDVLRDILGNVQEIVRSEVRLAKTGAWEEVVNAKSAAVWLGAGGLAALFAILFLLLMVVYALALSMPAWAAAMIVGAVLAVAAIVILKAGMSRFRSLYPSENLTVRTIKENVEWAKQHSKSQNT